MPYHLLLVEDDPSAAEMTAFYLRQEGFGVTTAADGPTAVQLFAASKPHLAIVDVMLPGFDGFELCRRLRHESNLPILLLTARTTDADKAAGLGFGADDYLTKPFSPTELIARVKALLRRAYQYTEPAPAVPPLLGGSRLQLDVGRHVAFFDGRALPLTQLEFQLLHALMQNPGWPFTRQHLLEQVWGYAEPLGEETVTVHISNLRQKLGADGPSLIRTIRGVGYAYEEGVVSG